MKKQKLTPQTKADDDKDVTVNKVEVHNEPDDDDEDLAYLLWNLQLDNKETTKPLYDTDECNCDNEGPDQKINAILSGNGMASEFPIEIDSYAAKCLYDSGASHSCMSYRCFKSAFPLKSPKKVDGLIVQNASGKSMQCFGMYEATINLGKRNFTHTFIVCEEHTNAIILGLDFSSRFRIGSDWTQKGTMYLHQGMQKLIERTVKGDVDNIFQPQKIPCLILKTHVTLPPDTLSVVTARVTDPKMVNSNQYVISDVGANFEAQYPDATTIPLVNHTTDKNHQDLAICLINPG